MHFSRHRKTANVANPFATNLALVNLMIFCVSFFSLIWCRTKLSLLKNSLFNENKTFLVALDDAALRKKIYSIQQHLYGCNKVSKCSPLLQTNKLHNCNCWWIFNSFSKSCGYVYKLSSMLLDYLSPWLFWMCDKWRRQLSTVASECTKCNETIPMG